QSDNLVNVYRLGDTFDPGWSECLELEISLDEFARMLADRDRSGWRDGLHPRCEIGRMADGRVFRVAIAGGDRAHHNFAGVHADARLDRHTSIDNYLGGVAAHLLLDAKGSIERALRMV